MGLPAVMLAIYYLERLGEKATQAYGFLSIFAGCLLLSAFLWWFPNDTPNDNNANFACLSVLIFTLNWGCNVGTYVLPVEIFPKEISATMFGLSAAAGKLGALAGAAAFDPLQEAYGMSFVYFVCGILSLGGVWITYELIEPFREKTWGKGRKQEDEDREEKEGLNNFA